MKEFFTKLKNIFITKKTTILICIIIILLLLFFIGISCSWYNKAVEEHTKTIKADTGNKQLEIYDPMNVDYGKLTPGWTDSKTFSVQNIGNTSLTYAIIWKEITNNYTRPADITLTINSTNDGGKITNIPLPSTGNNINIISDITIGPKVVQEYTLTFNYKVLDNTLQKIDSNKSFTGIITVISIN